MKDESNKFLYFRTLLFKMFTSIVMHSHQSLRMRTSLTRQDTQLAARHGQVPESSRVFYDPRKSSRVFYDLRKSSRVFYSSKMCCQVIQAMFQLNQCSKGGPCSTNNVVNPWGPGGRRKSGDTLVILFQPFTAGQNIYHCAVHLYTHLFVYVTIDLTD